MENKKRQLGIIALSIIFVVILVLLGIFGAFGAGALAKLTQGEPGAYGQPGFISGSGLNSSLSYPDGVSITEIGSCLDNYLSNKAPDSSPLQGMGETFAKAGKNKNVNPALLIAIAKKESSYATDWAAIRPSTHNYQSMSCGTVVPKDKYRCIKSVPPKDPDKKPNPLRWHEFPDYETSIHEHAAYMQRKYLSQGATSIEEIGKIYCENPTNWIEKTSTYFEDIVSTCSSLKTGGNIVDIALAEVDKCYDSDEDAPYNPSDEEWCGYFATWAYRKAGYDIPLTGGSRNILKWFSKNQYSHDDISKARPGEVVVWKRSPAPKGHIAIIVANNPSNQELTYIEGNTSNDCVKKRTHNYQRVQNSHSGIYGFGGFNN